MSYLPTFLRLYRERKPNINSVLSLRYQIQHLPDGRQNLRTLLKMR